MHRRLVSAAALGLALVPTLAFAASWTGGADDPSGDSTQGPGTDIVKAAWGFDNETGKLTVVVTFAQKPSGEDWGVINAVARDDTAEGCGGAEFARFRGNNNSTSASLGAGTSADGVQPDGSTGPSYVSATNTKSDDGRTTTIEGQHARLVGRNAGCVTLNVSHNGVLDAVSMPATAIVGTPNRNPGTTPPAYQVPGPAGDPRRVRLASSKRIRFSKGRARVVVIGASGGVTGKVRLLVGNLAVATGSFVSKDPVPVTVRLALTKKGKAWVRRHRKGGKARLTIRTELGTASAARTYRVRIVR